MAIDKFSTFSEQPRRMSTSREQSVEKPYEGKIRCGNSYITFKKSESTNEYEISITGVPQMIELEMKDSYEAENFFLKLKGALEAFSDVAVPARTLHSLVQAYYGSYYLNR